MLRILWTKEFSTFEITRRSHRWCQDRVNEWNSSLKNIGDWCTNTVTTTKKSEILSTHIMKNWKQYARQTIPEKTDHHNLEAALSQQSTSCVRPRANETSGNPPIRNKTAPKPKLILIAFSQRARKSIPANTWTRKDCEFENTSKYFTNPMIHKLSLIRRSNTIGICFDKHAKCWAKKELEQRNLDCCA